MTTTPRCDFSTIRRMALEWLSVDDFSKLNRPNKGGDDHSWLFYPGESYVEAKRREQARMANDYCRKLDRLVYLRKCIRETTDVDSLRRVLRDFDNGRCDDIDSTCRKLIKHIDRRC